MMKQFYFTLLITLYLFSNNAKAQTLNVFVSAHPDDWQLFMNPNAFHSLDSLRDKTIFLHTTAGDAGVGITNDYYLAREEGSLRAIRFMVNAHGNKEGYGNKMHKDSSKINGHSILNFSFANAKAYFLRLHDGFIVANDTMIEHSESLRNLYNSKINSITAIDKSTVYKSINDLKLTIKQLLEKESKGYNSLVLHVAQTDATINPNDHPDHLHSSMILQEISKELQNVTVYLYEEYASRQKPINVFPEDYLISAGTWGATASGLSDRGYYPTWDKVHNSWVGRQYFRKLE
jgi:hypothetical protein